MLLPVKLKPGTHDFDFDDEANCRALIRTLSAAMLWPDDETKRDEAVFAGEVSSNYEAFEEFLLGDDAGGTLEKMCELSKLLSEKTGAAPITSERDGWRVLFRMALAAVPPEIMKRRFQERFYYGMVAGEIYCEAVTLFKKNGACKLQNVKKVISEVFHHRTPGAPRMMSYSFSTIDNVIWPKYRAVAPYWAAISLRNFNGIVDEFPCSPKSLRDFLSLSKYFWDIGSTIQLTRRRTGETLFDPTNAPNFLNFPNLDTGVQFMLVDYADQATIDQVQARQSDVIKRGTTALERIMADTDRSKSE